MKNEELELTILRKAEEIENQRTLADELGYSVGKINYVMNALIEKGLIKVENFATAKNKKRMYIIRNSKYEYKNAENFII